MSRLAPRHFPSICLLALLTAIPASAQTYAELLSFNGNTAAGPQTTLTQGFNGDLYGTTYYGGTGTCFNGIGIGCGTVFALTSNGKFRVLYNFQSTSPGYPNTNLTLGVNGNLYGTFDSGNGIVFKITPGGVFTTVYTFTGGVDGGVPTGGLIVGSDGNFYGTTSRGGTPSKFCPSGCGTVFKMTPAGALTTLYSFCPQNYCPDGEAPAGPLAEGPDGNLYGVTSAGGLYKGGTFFRISHTGNFSLVYTFEMEDEFYSGLILGSDGNFYGISAGFVYLITPQGAYTAFGSPGIGVNLPTEGSDGNLYGTTSGAGSGGYGDIFEMPLGGGPYSQVHKFAGYPNDGAFPFAGLTQHTNGKFYGGTFNGGSFPCNFDVPGCGTVYSEDMGLPPFVAFVVGLGKVGQTFGLLGQGFSGTTGVSVNGVATSFTVKSDTLITATVPAGASTGYVTVDTPSGTLTSNLPFWILK